LNILNHKLQKANERLTEEIQQKHYESITDKLTGLYNTPYFNVRIKAESEHAKRYNHPLSLMFIDLNNFKSINETLGYDEANKIIADIGKVISESIRKVDSAFRYSSKQFAIILPETKDEGCITVSNRLIEKINKSITDTPPKSPASLAISIGIDQIKQDTDHEKLLKNAKDAAAKARSDGDNNVVIFSV
ncbi:MAG: GGDEF domain-containing protein, partial [Gammaproteobacteria bacterium]